MKTLTTLRSAALATFAVAAVSLPTLAQAAEYNNGYYNPNAECKSKENEAQLIGGVLGAIAGGVIGSQVSGNGARTEGSAVGAVLGGLAGAGIGDESVDCNKRRRRAYTSNRGYQRTTPVVHNRRVTPRRVYQPTRNNGRNNGYQNAGYNQGHYGNGRYNQRNRGYNNQRHHGGYNDGYGYNDGKRAALQNVRYRLRELRQKNRRLERRVYNDPYNYRLKERLDWVCNEIIRLERKERRLSRKVRHQNRRYY